MTDLELMQIKVADEIEERLFSDDVEKVRREASLITKYMGFSDMYDLIADVHSRRFDDAKAIVDKAIAKRVKTIAKWRMEDEE